MIEIKTKVGSLFIEEVNNREEDDRIKIYDSLGRYFDYFDVEYINEDWLTVEEFCYKLKSDLAEINDIKELFDYFGISWWKGSTDWTNLIEDIYNGDVKYHNGVWIDASDNSIITKKVLLENEWVNKIGNTYVLIKEN